MNNQEVGYVFAEKFNNEDISYGDGYNLLRGKGYSASFDDLVFTTQFYGDPQYGLAKYNGNSDGFKIQWVFTSSLTQSFYDKYPNIDPSETLLVLYQNYIPTASGTPAFINYSLYLPTGSFLNSPYTSNTNTLIFSGEYYIVPPTESQDYNLRITTSVGSNVFSTAGTGSYSWKFSVNSGTQIKMFIRGRFLNTGSVAVFRNIKLEKVVDISNFEPFAQTQDLHLQTSTGMTNARYNGCKMTSPDFNIDSSDTVDGGPVVTVTPVNPKAPTIGTAVPKKKITKADQQSTGFVSGKGNFKIK